MGEFDFEEGEPPSVPESRGHSHHRSRLINFIALRNAVTDKRDAALETLFKLDRIIGEEEITKRSLTEVVASETVRLLEGLGFVSEGSHANREAVAREQIEAKLAANRRSAETATAARPEVERRISLHNEQLATLNKRERDFLNPALVEMVEFLGPLYNKRIAALREVMEILFALGDAGYAPGWEKIERPAIRQNPHDSWRPIIGSIPEIKFPRPRLDMLKLVPDERFTIKLGDKNPWKAIAEQLLDDPSKTISLPKLVA